MLAVLCLTKSKLGQLGINNNSNGITLNSGAISIRSLSLRVKGRLMD